MKTGWHSVELGKHVSLINGFAFLSGNFTEGDGMPLIRIRDLGNRNTEIRYTGSYTETYVVNTGDLLIGMDGDFNTVRWGGDKALLNQRVCKLVTKDQDFLNQEFLFFRIIEEINKIHRITSATTVKHLASKDVLGVQLDLPTPEEQTQIAAILSTIDKAIEQTEAIIAKQQRIKTGLMQDLLTRGIDEAGNIRSEATHEFKDSPLGRIPVEWEVKVLSELADVDRGQFTHRPRNDPMLYGGKYPFIQTGDITSHIGRQIDSFTQTLNDQGIRVSKKFPAGTIAITIAANIADTAILSMEMYFPDSVVGAIVKEPNNIRFIELMIRSRKPKLEQLAPQSAQKNINLETLRPLAIPTPSSAEQKRIGDFYERQEIDQIRMETRLRKLAEIKTGLMQDLLTGKVRVTDLLTPSNN